MTSSFSQIKTPEIGDIVEFWADIDGFSISPTDPYKRFFKKEKILGLRYRFPNSPNKDISRVLVSGSSGHFPVTEDRINNVWNNTSTFLITPDIKNYLYKPVFWAYVEDIVSCVSSDTIATPNNNVITTTPKMDREPGQPYLDGASCISCNTWSPMAVEGHICYLCRTNPFRALNVK